MFLTPVHRLRSLTLSDSGAAPPRGLPDERVLRKRLKREVEELGHLQSLLYADRRYALLVVLQGRDTSGKDGTIKNVFDGCNPLGCRVAAFGAPTPLELSHDFLWRVHAVIPPRGFIGIFNRSHYEDVLVARVRGLVPRPVWRHRYDHIREFERMLSESGVVILKFFLHISHDEQRRRLIARLQDPEKNWKFNAGDLEDRRYWAAYTRAYHDALRKCSTPWAPWYVVPADEKLARNYLVTRLINRALRKLRLRYPRSPRKILALTRRIR